MILALAVIGAALVSVLVLWMLALFIKMAVADSGYVGRHRAPPARKTRRSQRPSAPRSYHRTPGSSRPGVPAQARKRQAPISL